MGSLLSQVRLCNPMDCGPPGSSVHGDSPAQKYWSGLPCPSPGDLPDPGVEPGSPASRADSLPAEPPGHPVGAGTALITKDGERLAEPSPVTAASVHRRD